MPRIPRTLQATLSFTFRGQRIEAKAGDSIAAALLAAGHSTFRTTPVSGTPRGAMCMMGVCFECLVQVDGQGNQQACMRAVTPGMVVEPQEGAFDALSLPLGEDQP